MAALDFSNAKVVGPLDETSVTPTDTTSTGTTVDFSKAKPVSDEEISSKLELKMSELSDLDSDRVLESRQGEDESWAAYSIRMIADGFERSAVNSLDTVLPDDWVDKWRGEGTRGMDINKSYVFQNPDRFMTPVELYSHRKHLRKIVGFEGEEPLPPQGTPQNPLNTTETIVRFLSAGTEGAGDITNLATTAPRIVANVAQSFAPSAMADLVVNETADALADSDLSPSTKQNILMGLGIGTGVTTGVMQSTVPIIYNSIKAVKNSNALKDIDVGLDSYQQRFALKVAANGGNFSDIMQQAYEVQEAMGGPPLKIIPIAAAMSNDIMENQFAKFYGEGGDPTFRANISEAIEEFEVRHAEYLHTLNVDPNLPKDFTVPKAIEIETNKRTLFEEKRQQFIQNKIDEADANIYKVTESLVKNNAKTDIGAAAKGLLEKKKVLVKQRLSPMYTEWKKTANAQGVELAPEGVDNLLGWVENLPLDEGKFLKGFSPLLSLKARTDIDPETGLSLESYSATDMLQLKNQVNGRIRDLSGTTDSAGQVQLRLLNRFKQGPLAQSLDELPDGFGDSLRQIDEMYYTEMGIPFNASGVSKMSVTKFTTTVAEDLTKLQNARDFIGAVGEEGVPVLKDAIYAKINSRAIKGNDPANEKTIKAWLNDPDNAELISLVPNLADELSDASVAISTSKSIIARLKEDYASNAFQATNDFLKLTRNAGLDSTVAKMIQSEGASMADITPLLKNMDKDSEAMFRTGIRLQLTERAMNNKIVTLSGATQTKAQAFMEANRKVYTEFFGEDYIDNFGLAMKAFDIVDTGGKVANIPIRSATASNELLKGSTGIGASEYGAAVRRVQNRFMSPIGAASTIASKFFQFKINGKKEARLKELVYDPLIVSKLAKLYKSFDEATLGSKAIAIKNAIKDTLLKNSRRGAYAGSREARLTEYGTSPEQEQN
tara:strand:+ start:518 stop:3355 length:2838 start_codon:yes stop_codon:yes gene_type:complete